MSDILSTSYDLLLIEKCKIVLWMEQFQNALKVQSKFKLEFFKYPPPVSAITEIHRRFLATGSVLDYQNANPAYNVTNSFNLIKKPDEDTDVIFKDIPLKKKWRETPKIKIIENISKGCSVKKEDVSIAQGDLNEEEMKECMIEISLNETNIGDLIEGDKHPEKYLCIHCGQGSVDEVSHSRHLKVHCSDIFKVNSSDFFNCPNCEFTCNNTSLLRSHRITCKPLNSNLNWTGKSESVNFMHDDIHNSLEQNAFYSRQHQIICKMCNSIFTSEKILDEHVINKCSLKSYASEGPKQENISNSIIMIPEQHQHKLKYVSDDEDSTVFPKCTTYQITLAKKNKIFSCDQCSFTTHKKVYLKNHKTIHNDGQEMPHECPLCAQKFRSKRSLSYHTDNSHIDKEVLECPFCDFRQKNKMLLQIHMRRHTGEKPYKCDKPDCNFKGRISQELRKHMQVEHSMDYKTKIS